MPAHDTATIQALRSDVALQIARLIKRSGETQVAAGKRLDIPQPTLSKIMRGDVSTLSLELLIRIAVRARLPIVLQTGTIAAEAGAFVCGGDVEKAARQTKSRVGDEARRGLSEVARRMTPEQRLEAQVKHSELMTTLHRSDRFRDGRMR